MIYTITMNPALDYFMDFENQEVKKWSKTDHTKLMFGGKGINASTLLTNFGVENKALIFSGGTTGEILRKQLDENNIDVVNFNTKNEVRINVKARFEDTYEFISTSVNNNENILLELKSYLTDHLKKDDVVMIMGSMMENLPKDSIDQISKLSLEKNARLIFDVSGQNMINALKYNPFLIKPNKAELSEIFNTEIKTYEDIKRHAKKLLELGAQNVIVSDAENGAYLFNDEVEISTPPIKINLVNGSGAGDSMIAGFTLKYLETKNYEEAIKFANASGAGTASVISIADAETISNIFKQI